MKVRAALLLSTAAVLAAACGSKAHSSHFVDTFEGDVFPDHGWVTAGTPPVLNTTAGEAAPSLNWTACAGTNGAEAVIDQDFYGAYRFDARLDFEITGAVATSGTGIAFHIIGNDLDDFSAVILPPPAGELDFIIDSQVASGSITADSQFHSIEFLDDSVGQAGWFLDGGLIFFTGPVPSAVFRVELICAEGDTLAHPVPILIDNVVIDSRPDP